MRKLIIILVVVLGVIGLGYGALQMLKLNTKKHSPEAEVPYFKGDFKVSVAYCQPAKKGREIFGNLVPYNEVWRTGANEATHFTTNKDLKFAEGTLPKGTYSLFSIPNEGEWTIIFNNKNGQWGTQYDQDEDQLRVKAKPSKLDETVEIFRIRFDEAQDSVLMQLEWDQTRVSLPIQPL